MTKRILKDLEFKVLIFQYKELGKQIHELQMLRQKMVTDTGMTMQSFHQRKRDLGLK